MIEDLQELLNYCNEEIDYLRDKNIGSEKDVGCYETFINMRIKISNIIDRDKEDQLVFIEPPINILSYYHLTIGIHWSSKEVLI